MPTRRIPVTNAPRQRLAVQLGDVAYRLEIWRAPNDGYWYCSLEEGDGSPVVYGRSLASRSSVLPAGRGGQLGVMPVDPLSEQELGLTPWGRTHQLVWQPD